MDIYENIIVGNFLYGLGVQMGLRHAERPNLPMCVNLLQQTPLDRRLGDVFIANAAVYRLIEFKRTANESEKEPLKRQMLEDALSDPETAHLKTISREVHWYVESDNRGDQWLTRSVPYIDYQASPPFITMDAFMTHTAEAAASEKMTDHKAALCRAYIKLVAKLAPEDTTSSGALVLFVTGDGELQYATLADIKDLFRPVREILARQEQRLSQVRVKRLVQARTMSQGRSHGHER